MSIDRIHSAAALLRDAEERRSPCGRPSEVIGPLTVDEAYAVQSVNIERRLARGARVIGKKIGVTSRAVQEWLQVGEPDFGILLDDMEVMDSGTCPRTSLLQPRVEGELAFVLREDLPLKGVSAGDVLRATDFVVPAIEIIDSRVADWKIAYVDTVADNASSGRFVLGTKKTRLDGLDLPMLGMVLRKNGRVASTGAGAACLGNPVAAVVWLANRLGALGTGLQAGEVILSGALGPVVPVEAGDVIDVEIAQVGSATVRFV